MEEKFKQISLEEAGVLDFGTPDKTPNLVDLSPDEKANLNSLMQTTPLDAHEPTSNDLPDDFFSRPLVPVEEPHKHDVEFKTTKRDYVTYCTECGKILSVRRKSGKGGKQ